MGYNNQHFYQLTEKYGRYGGWAIWDYGRGAYVERSTDCIYQNLHLLHANYVIVGLNVSAPIPINWENFRGGRHDRKMKYAFNDSPLRGSYMTDLYKGIADPKAHSLEYHLDNNQHIIPDHVAIFRNEMEDIGLTDESTFLVLGPESSIVGRHFNSYFRKHFPNNRALFHRHYSSWGTDQAWVESVWNLLRITGDYEVIRGNYR